MVDEAFQQYSETVADTKKGMLWQPIQKLMKQAKQNRKTVKLGNLSLEDKQQELAGLPMPALEASLQPGLSIQEQTEGAGDDANTRMDEILQSGKWVNGILDTASTSFNVLDTSSSEGLDGLTSPPGLQSDSSAFDLVETNATEEPGDLVDMAWMNWEGFVGDVNFYDFEMPDLTEGFPR